jgi:hypothetical protein
VLSGSYFQHRKRRCSQEVTSNTRKEGALKKLLPTQVKDGALKKILLILVREGAVYLFNYVCACIKHFRIRNNSLLKNVITIANKERRKSIPVDS